MKNKIRKAVFIVVYFEEKGKRKYLILKRKLHWKGWEFPKGGVKKFETKRFAVKREVKEETGLKPLKIIKFDVFGKYSYSREYSDRKGYGGQSFSLYSARVRKGEVKLDTREHSDYEWVSFKEARRRLKWENQKKCLEFVNKNLREKK